MALAAYADSSESDLRVTVDELIIQRPGKLVQFRNDWQHRIDRRRTPLENSPLAAACQRATEIALLNYARYASTLSRSRHLCVAGGIFLNILANSILAERGPFDDIYVPSAPHDAGVSIGCAFRGAIDLGDQPSASSPNDRLGPIYTDQEVLRDVERARAFLTTDRECSVTRLAERINDGQIIARHFGRSEFGPRALGNRSLLASPLHASSKCRLNRIKGRQSWRPVAPIVPEELFDKFFTGPAKSPYMSYAHRIRDEHVSTLIALEHPDGTTRAQTNASSEDPQLHALLLECGRLTGYPLLVNTSFNGPDEPIVERPSEAIAFMLRTSGVDGLLIGDILYRVKSVDAWWASCANIRVSENVAISVVALGEKTSTTLTRSGVSVGISSEFAATLMEGRNGTIMLRDASPEQREEVFKLARLGYLESV